VQSSSHIITTNKPTPNFFTGRMPFLLPNQQCQSTEGKKDLGLVIVENTVGAVLAHKNHPPAIHFGSPVGNLACLE